MVVELWYPTRGDFVKTYNLPNGFTCPKTLKYPIYDLKDGVLIPNTWLFIEVESTTEKSVYEFSHVEANE